MTKRSNFFKGKFLVVLAENQVNCQHQRLPRRSWYDSFETIAILGLFGSNLVSTLKPKSAEKRKKNIISQSIKNYGFSFDGL